MRILYIDRLSFIPLLHILIKGNSYSRIFYLDGGVWIEGIIRFLGRAGVLRSDFKRTRFILADMSDESGGNLYGKMMKDLMVIIKSVREGEIAGNKLILGFGKMFDLKKLLFCFDYPILEVVEGTVFLFNAAIWHSRTNYGSGAEFIVFFRDGLFSKYLLSYADSLNIRVKRYPAIIKLPLRKYFLSGARIIKKKLSAGSRRSRELRDNYSGDNIQREKMSPRISALYTGKSVAFSLNKRSDFFWFFMSDIPREDILVYFDSIEMPEPEKSAERMKKEGIGFINMPGWSSTKTCKDVKEVLFKILLRTYLINLVQLTFIRSFYFINMYYFILKYAYWYDFFKTNNIKVNLNQNLFFRESCPKMLALEMSGGINIAYQYTNIAYTADYGYRIFSDILFLFGPDYGSIVDDSYSIINNMIYCGFITDYSFSKVEKDAGELRSRLLDRGAKFVICYFDENSSDDTMSTISNRTCLNTYRRLLDLILSDETLGLICNSKFPNNLFKKLRDIEENMNKALGTGRLIFMGGSRTSDNYPTEVAQASDICVGHLLGGTTILESYLSGVPSVFLDTERLYTLDIYKWGKGKVVFDDIDDLFNVIRKYRDNPNCIPGFGNLDSWVKNKDPFKDGNASLRIGQYIKWLHEKLSEGYTKNKTMEYANLKFTELWGKDNLL